MRKISFIIIIFIMFFPYITFGNIIQDPLRKYQEWLNIINYYDFLRSKTGYGEGIVVAVIDSGVWLNHPDLYNNIWKNNRENSYDKIDNDSNGYVDDYYGYNFVDDNADMESKDSHGTAVAGIIAAQNNQTGIVGMAPKAKIMSLIVCDYYGCSPNNIAKAIRYAADNGAHIINLSLGTSGYLGYSNSLDDAILYAYNKGVIIVSAAGNGDVESSGSRGQDLSLVKASPVNNDVNNINTVIGVGALDSSGKYRTNWSNYGQGVDVFAPGEKIVSTVVPVYNDGYYYSDNSGTSFSAPIVSGAFALLKSKYPQKKNWELVDLVTSKSILNIDDIFNNVDKLPCRITMASQFGTNDSITVFGEHFNSNIIFMMSKADGSATYNINNYIKSISAREIKINNVDLPIKESGYYSITTQNNICPATQNTFQFTSVNNIENVKSPVIVNDNDNDDYNSIVDKEKRKLTKINTSLSSQLSGKILLQVEQKGEAWYLNPKNNKRYFLGRPADAFRIMRELGLGISEKNYNSFKGYAPSWLSGRILLRVEAKGEAYYVNPVDLKMHFLGRPSDAFELMRKLGLGISNNDIYKIDISD